MQPVLRKPLGGHESKSNGNRRAAKYRRCLKSLQRQVDPRELLLAGGLLDGALA